MSRARKYTRHPEFAGLEEFVWEGLNRIGRPITQIESDQKRTIAGDPIHSKFKDRPIWHTKAELDRFVADGLCLKFDDYGKNKSENALYKEIANEVGRLRRAKILVDWRHLDKKNTGMGVWHLDKTKLEQYAANRFRREIKNKNFHSKGEMCVVFVRQKQNAFREELFREYGKCVLCGFKIPEYMIGAHIVPYAVMRVKDASNSMNPSNGLLLCRFCDVAFERGSITIEEDYGIEVSDHLRDQGSSIVKSWLKPIPSELYIRPNAKYPPNPAYLKWKMKLLRGTGG